MTTVTLKYNQIYKNTNIDIFNIEQILLDKLTKAQDISEIREAAIYFYSQSQMNHDTMVWFSKTEIDILKECYL